MKKSAGILLFTTSGLQPEIFLVHPGGPFWKNKDLGAWSIPKGEFTAEEPLDAAIREFEEETGYRVKGNFFPLKPVTQKAGKIVLAWALEKYIDPALIKSNSFEMEWPPKSGLIKSFPEIDRAGWFNMDEALQKIIPAQAAFIIELRELLLCNARN